MTEELVKGCRDKSQGVLTKLQVASHPLTVSILRSTLDAHVTYPLISAFDFKSIFYKISIITILLRAQKFN